MRTIAIIFARGGSKGLPGKNTRLLMDKPLIAWSIHHALAVKRINHVMVSTDCPEIAAVAREYGAEVPFMRPAELATDESPEWLAWRHALNYLVKTEGSLPDILVSVPTTSPLRLPSDIEKCLDEFEKGSADMVVTMTDAHRSPYFNMLKENPDGSVGLVCVPQTTLTHRQDAPKVYDMTTVAYVARPEFVMTHNGTFEGRVRAVHVPLERSIDIDTLLDFQIAAFLLERRENKP